MRDTYPGSKMPVIGETQSHVEDGVPEQSTPPMLVLGEKRPQVEDGEPGHERRPRLNDRITTLMAKLAVDGPAEVARRMHEINGTKRNDDNERIFARDQMQRFQTDSLIPTAYEWAHAVSEEKYKQRRLMSPEGVYNPGEKFNVPDVEVANTMPFPNLDFHNTRSRRDHDEATAIREVLDAADSTIFLKGKNELEERYTELDGSDQDRIHKRFYKEHKDALHTNALVDAALNGVKIDTQADVDIPSPRSQEQLRSDWLAMERKYR